MKVDPQDYLRLCEKANTIAFVDIEATGLRADYNSTLVVSVKPYQSRPTSLTVVQPGNDQKVVRQAKDLLEQYDIWVTFYGKGYDIPFLNTRLLKWGMKPIEKRPHVDLYYTQKANLLMARRSLAHSLRFLATPEQKMDMSPDEWNQVIADPVKAMPRMIKRCESDVITLQQLYDQIKHIIRDINK